MLGSHFLRLSRTDKKKIIMKDTRFCVLSWIDSLTCPLQVTDDHFVTQIARMPAPFVSLLRPLHSDWCNSWLLTLIDWAKKKLKYQSYSPKDNVCILEANVLKPCSSLWNKLTVHSLQPCLLASSGLYHCLCWCIATFVATNCQSPK